MSVIAVAAALAGASAVPSAAAQSGHTHDDDHWVEPISVRGEADPTGAMRRALPAGFRDLGPLVGFRSSTSSYAVVTRDVDDDGWTDVLISHHGHRADLFMNQPAGALTTGMSIAITFFDTLHNRRDRHGCTIDDLNLDGLDDVFCAKGARSGTAKKWNELWMQAASNVWTDQAATYGVEDHWGRGRFPAFIDLNRDRYPDLFVGNDIPRKDEHATPNRTFVNVRGERFKQVKLGLTREIGDTCTDVADYDRDGREDLLVCGRHRLFLFRRLPSGFRDVRERVGLPWVRSTSARFADFDGDRRLDLVYLTVDSLVVRLQRADHSFGPVVARRPLLHGHGVAVGDPDGDRDADIYVVEGCVARVNRDDWLLVNDGSGERFALRRVDRVHRGCGDTAAAFDFDRDGKDEFVVLNGGGKDQPLDLDGPDQLLTMGNWGL